MDENIRNNDNRKRLIVETVAINLEALIVLELRTC